MEGKNPQDKIFFFTQVLGTNDIYESRMISSIRSINKFGKRGWIIAKACSLICRFLVIANGMAACYSLLQGARCLVSILTGGVLISRPMAWAIFSCDQASIYNYHQRRLEFLVAVGMFLQVCYLSPSSDYIVLLSFSKLSGCRFCCSVALELSTSFVLCVRDVMETSK
jgi:hypothetical protein